NPATRRSFSLLSSGMVSTYSLKWTPACPGIHRDESASAMSAYKLTPPQAKLMRTFDPADEIKTGTNWCCEPDELRPARACQDKGLLTIDGEPGRGEHFEVKLTLLGIEVVRLMTTGVTEPA
ncbi:hypothetical protein, partial [Burkholderia aenigmatica]